MRLLLLITTFAVSLVTEYSAVAQEAGSARRLAVVIGVNAYRSNSNLPRLRHAASDAKALSSTLRRAGYTVYEMTHEASREEGQETMAPQLAYIRDQIQGTLDFPNLGPKDSVLVTLHGHGVQYDQVDTDGTRIPGFYFCPADATVTGLRTANDITATNRLLPLHELYRALENCTAGTKLLIVDACRNDPTSPNVFRETLASATLPKLPPPTGGTAAFFSCKANQRAVEDVTLNQGVFSHFLVKGLQGEADLSLGGRGPDGIVTFSELSTYVANNTYAHVFNKFKVRQSPELRGDYDLNLPLVQLQRRTAPEMEPESVKDSMASEAILLGSISAPSKVKLGDEFVLKLTVTNPNESSVTLDSIDVFDSFLEGFEIVSISPSPQSDKDYESLGFHSWDFGRSFLPDATLEVAYTLRATKSGHFSGNIDICNPAQKFKRIVADVVVEGGTTADLVLDCSLSAPSKVELGDEFDLTVTVNNPYASNVILDSIDIYDSFLDGFDVLSVSPIPESGKDYDALDFYSWDFDKSFASDEKLEITYSLRATKVGHFEGDVDVCNPQQDFKTLVADILVEEGTPDALVLKGNIYAPSKVRLGDEFDLTVTVSNPYSSRVTLDSIDVYHSFLKGFEVVSVNPARDRVKQYDGLSFESWYFERTFSEGEDLEIVCRLRATKTGTFRGDFDICNPVQDFNSVEAEIVVEEATTDNLIMDASLSAPKSVELGEVFDLELILSNPYSSEATLNSVDLDHTFLKGFEVISVSPSPESDKSYDSLGFHTWYYRNTYAPGDALNIVYKLRATSVGEFKGDFDICNSDQDFKSVTVEIEVNN